MCRVKAIHAALYGILTNRQTERQTNRLRVKIRISIARMVHTGLLQNAFTQSLSLFQVTPLPDGRSVLVSWELEFDDLSLAGRELVFQGFLQTA